MSTTVAFFSETSPLTTALTVNQHGVVRFVSGFEARHEELKAVAMTAAISAKIGDERGVRFRGFCRGGGWQVRSLGQQLLCAFPF